MECDPDISSLLIMLKELEPGSTSLINTTTIRLMYKLFSREDYVSLAAQLVEVSDAKNMLDVILYLLPNLDLDQAMNIKQRARRFMMKVVTKTPVMPESLFVTGVRIPAQHDYIGHGGFGHVFKGELRGDTVALKVLYKADNNAAFCREALMWRSLRHKFVLPLLGIYRNESMEQFFLVSPYMKNGTLAQWRKKANPSIAKVEERILEVAKGIEYIHSEGIVHGDLRGVNVLLDAHLHVQIADFGLTRVSEATNTRSGALHVSFAAPELFGYCEDGDFEDDNDVPIRTQKSDVYAFGCLYYEIHYDSIPFAGKTDVQIMRLHSRETLPPRLDSPPLSDEAWNLILSCWMREASKRPRIEAVAEKMAVASQSFASPCASAAQHPTYDVLPRAPWWIDAPSLNPTSATAARPLEEPALHYGIPTRLPPQPQPKPTGMLHEKSTDNTMTDEYQALEGQMDSITYFGTTSWSGFPGIPSGPSFYAGLPAKLSSFSYTDVINPTLVAPAAPHPSVSFMAPICDFSPTSQSPSTTTSTVMPPRRPTSTTTGTHKNISPDKLIPLDAPAQLRHVPDGQSREKIHECTMCHKQFARASSLNRHVRYGDCMED